MKLADFAAFTLGSIIELYCNEFFLAFTQTWSTLSKSNNHVKLLYICKPQVG